MTSNDAAQLLAEAWRRRQRLTTLPADSLPADEAAAYACQDRLLTALADELGAPIGYKIGCTNDDARRLLGLDGPFYGRLVGKRARSSPARYDAGEFFMRVIEPEFAFEMASELDASAAPYDAETVAAAVGAVLPAIEIVDSRFEEWTKVGGPSLIADNGSNGAWVCGEPYRDWRSLDLPNHTMTLTVNNETVREGRGDLVMGDPLNSLRWLADALAAQGRTLRAGDRVSTGVCCQVYRADAGDVIRADFGVLGSVELTFDR